MKVFLAIPTINKIFPDVVNKIFKITKDTKHETQLFFISQQPTDVSRNKCVEAFLKTDCDVLWFLDDDQIPLEDIYELLDKDFDIIAPLTYIYQEHNLIPNLFMIDDNKKRIKKDTDIGLEKVDACGMGCVFIKRDVFEKIQKPYFKFLTNDEHNLVTESETFYFFNKCKQQDINVFVDTSRNCGHIKNFNLDLVGYQMAKAVSNCRGRKND